LSGRRIIASLAAAAILAGMVFSVGLGDAPGDNHRLDARFSEVRASHCPSDRRLLDRHGEVLHETRVDDQRRRLAWTALADLSPALVDAVVASEDRRFYAHSGVDVIAVAAAAWNRVIGGPPRGASTLTMQLAALLDPTLERGRAPRGLAAKLAQMRAARRLEASWSKNEILEAYLNLVTFRGEVRGAAAAAHAFFAKAPHGLTAAEGLVLAASLRAPNADREDLLRRADRMATAPTERIRQSDPTATALSDRIRRSDPAATASSGEVAAAVDRLVAAPDRSGPRARLAPHAMRLLHDSGDACRDLPSSLDRRVQEIAAAALHRHLVELEDRSARDGAVLVVDNTSGEVLAYVGSSGALSAAAAVDGVQARRQAGSTLKPFLYAAALDRSLVTPATLLEDSPLEVPLDGGVFAPANYDERFRGLVSVRSALASSLNIPAVRTLLLVGEGTFAGVLRDLGVEGVREDGEFYGPSLALGSADVSLWQLVGAYRGLAVGGVFTPLRWKAPDREADPPRTTRVFTEEAAFLVADMLADRESRAAAFGLDSVLSTRFWTAVKTGTSKDMRDNWCLGFSSRYTVGVWVGNFSGEPMRDVSGVAGAAPIWQDVMEALHEHEPSEAPSPPTSIVAAWTRFANDVEPARREWFRRGTEPSVTGGELARLPRIVAPADGAILAIDPDIPAQRQRLLLRADPPEAAQAWRLDGLEIAGEATAAAWEPVRGRHELVLLDAERRPLDTVRFEVRGSPGKR
jgi:penicillin-binding protein 1C